MQYLPLFTYYYAHYFIRILTLTTLDHWIRNLALTPPQPRPFMKFHGDGLAVLQVNVSLAVSSKRDLTVLQLPFASS